MKFRISVAIAFCAMVVGALPALADLESTSLVTWFHDPAHPEGMVVKGASSTLERESNSIETSMHTVMLPAGTANTLWYVIFNEPSKCKVAFGCGAADLGNPMVKGSVQFADGMFVGAAGVADFESELVVGDKSTCQPGKPCSGLLNPLGAEIHLVVRNHGPAQPGREAAQIGSFAGGCKGLDPKGTFNCYDSQASRHDPRTATE